MPWRFGNHTMDVGWSRAMYAARLHEAEPISPSFRLFAEYRVAEGTYATESQISIPHADTSMYLHLA
jgi:hypothetical protein